MTNIDDQGPWSELPEELKSILESMPELERRHLRDRWEKVLERLRSEGMSAAEAFADSRAKIKELERRALRRMKGGGDDPDTAT